MQYFPQLVLNHLGVSRAPGPQVRMCFHWTRAKAGGHCAPSNDGLEVGLELGLIEAVGRAFGREPILA